MFCLNEKEKSKKKKHTKKNLFFATPKTRIYHDYTPKRGSTMTMHQNEDLP